MDNVPVRRWHVPHYCIYLLYHTPINTTPLPNDKRAVLRLWLHRTTVSLAYSGPTPGNTSKRPIARKVLVKP